MGDNEFRWELAGSELQPALFEAAASIEPRRELVQVEYLHVQARTIISRVPNASQMPFTFTINAYRGCTHACTYCFARPTHTYLGMDGGEDFERRIVVKVNAAERLRSELAHPRWEGEHIAMGTNTDPYQPCEGRYRLTRSIVEVLGEAANPFSILTKSPMIVRDLDALCAAAERAEVHASFSVGTLDRDVWRASEPGTPPPERRIEAMARLNEAGIPTGVLIGPVIPGMSDDEAGLERVVEAAIGAGAVSVAPILLHLRRGVRELFMPWLERERPDLLPLYAELYRAPGGYAPRAAQQRLSDTVRRLVARHGGTAVAPRRWRGIRERPPPAQQLSLGV